MRVMPECARANIRGPKTRKVALRGLRRSDCRPGPDDGDWSRAWRARLFRPQHQLQLSLSLSRTPSLPCTSSRMERHSSPGAARDHPCRQGV